MHSAFSVHLPSETRAATCDETEKDISDMCINFARCQQLDCSAKSLQERPSKAKSARVGSAGVVPEDGRNAFVFDGITCTFPHQDEDAVLDEAMRLCKASLCSLL